MKTHDAGRLRLCKFVTLANTLIYIAINNVIRRFNNYFNKLLFPLTDFYIVYCEMCKIL